MKKTLFPFLYYLVLVSMLAVGIFLFLSFRTNTTAQIYTGLTMSVLYIIWGILYHRLCDTLHMQIVVEYLLVGLIAMALIVTLIWI